MTLKISNKLVGMEYPTLIVAEIGANHNNDLELIKRTIDAAVECGVDAIKFQTYTSNELLSDYDRLIVHGKSGSEVTEKIGVMFDKLSLKREWHKEIFNYVTSKGLIAFSTPFSLEGVDFLNSFDVPCFKVAASDVNYIKMLQYMARKGKPVMLSVGKSSIGEVEQAIETLEENGCKELVVMHCVSQYPSPMDEMNLRVIETLKLQYPDAVIGFSDHSLGATAAIGAVVLGARVIEKHFTLDKSLEGPDHWFSMDPSDMKFLVNEIRNIEKALGNSRKRIVRSEENERKTSTRSIVLNEDINSGDIIEEKHLKFTRPGWGIDPIDLDKVVGLKPTQSLTKNTVLMWSHFK